MSLPSFHCPPLQKNMFHDDVIKWRHFPRNWPFVRGIHRSPVNSPHKGQWRGALMFTLICARINGWVNTREAGDLRRYRPHYDVIVMCWPVACKYLFDRSRSQPHKTSKTWKIYIKRRTIVTIVLFTVRYHIIGILMGKHSWAWWRHQWKDFTRHWPFVQRIQRSPVNSPHKGQWRWALIFSMICD